VACPCRVCINSIHVCVYSSSALEDDISELAHHWALLHMHAHGGFVSLRARFVLVLLLLLCLGTFRELRYRVSRSRVSFQIKLSSSLIKLSPCPCLSVFLVTHAFTPLQDDNYKHKEWRRKPQG
jgi:hypothetical protein